MNHKIRTTFLSLLLLGSHEIFGAAPPAFNWKGGGSPDGASMDQANNWTQNAIPASGDSLVLTGTVQSFTVHQNIPSPPFNLSVATSFASTPSITIVPIVGTPYSISGSAFAVQSGSNGLIDFGGGPTVPANTFACNVSVPSGSTLFVGGNNKDVFSSQISGAGNVAFGAGPLVLTATSSYTGTTTLSGEVLINIANAIPPTSILALSSANGVGTMVLNASQSITINQPVVAGSQVTTNANSLTITNLGSSTNWAASIVGGFATSGSGTGGSVILGAGSTGNTLILSNGNTYSVKSATATFIGNTSVLGGTLQTGSLAALGQNSNLTIASGATLDLSPLVSLNANYSVSFNQVSGAGSWLLGTSTGKPVIFVYDGGTTFSGTLTGNAGITYVGANTWTLPQFASASYTGPIIISGGGTLTVNGLPTGSPLSTVSIQTVPGAVLQASGGFTANNPMTFASNAVIDTQGFTVTLGGLIGGGGGLQKNGSAGTLILSGSNSYTGPTTVAGGTLAITNTGSTSISSATAPLILNGGNVTTPSGSNALKIGYLSGSSGTLALGSNSITIQHGDGPLPAQTTFLGQISGSAGISLGGTLTATTASTPNTSFFSSYTGPLTLGITGVGTGILTTSSLGTVSQLNFNFPAGTLHMTESFTFNHPVAIETTGGTSTVATFDADSGVIITLNGAITAASTTTLEVEGSGTVILAAANPSLVGAVDITGGTLQLNNASALSSATAVNIYPTGTLNLNGNSTSVQQLIGFVAPPAPGARVALGSGTLTITAGSSVFPFYGTISGTGNVVLSGAGTSPTFIGTNTYTGTTTLQSGTYFNTENLGASTSYIFSGGSTGGGVITIGSTCSSSATLSIASATPATISTNTYNLTLSGVISSGDATASLIHNGEGTLFLTGTNTFTGNLILQGGIVSIPKVAALGNPASIISQQFAGTLQVNTNTGLNITPTWVVATTGIFDTNGLNATYSGSIVPQTYANINASIGGSIYGGFSVTGGGTLTLTGTNTYNGPTTILNGTLVASPISFPTTVTPLDPNPLPSMTKLLVFNATGNGATATFTAGASFSTFPQMIFFSSGTINTGSFNITASNIISGATTSTITKAGAGTLILSGSNIYTGPTSVTAGILQAGIASTSTSGAFGLNSAVAVSSGATLALSGFSNAVGTLAGSGSITLGAGTLTVSNPSSASSSFSGPITDSGAGGGLTVSQGTLALTGTTSYTGTTTINTGATLSLNTTSSSIGSVSNAGTLVPYLPTAAASYSQATTGTLDVSNITTFPGTGAINGSGAATLAGTLILPHQRPTSNAVLLQHSSTSGAFSTVVNLANGTTISYGSSQTIWNVGGSLACTGIWQDTSAGNWGVVGNWSGSCAPGVNNQQGTYDDQAIFQNLAGHASLTVTMANSAGNAAQDVTLGLLTLGDTVGGTTQYTIQAFGGGTTGVITMGGPTAPDIYVYQGTHVIQAPLTLAASTTILSQTIGATLNVSGAVTLGANTLTVQNGFASPTGVITVSGNIGGTGGLALAGGTLSLTATNSFTGGIAISNSGLLKASIPAALPSTITFASAGTLQASTGNLTTLPALVLTGAATLDTNSHSMTATGIISGSGSLTKISAGTLTLSASNTYTGATTVTGGTLQAGIISTGTSGAFGVGSAVSVGSGATLALQTFNNAVGSISGVGAVNLGSAILTINSGGGNTLSGQISGSGGITLLSGTQILSGTSNYTGATTVSGGTLQAGIATAAFGSSSPIVLSGSGTLSLNNLSNTVGSLSSTSTSSSVLLGSATLTINAPSGQSFQGVISGTGGVTLSGSGTQTLAGANTYTGATFVSAGVLQAAISSTFSGSVQTSGAFGVGSTVTVSPGATLALASSNQTTIGILSGAGAGSITLGSSAVLTIANGNSQTFAGSLSGNGGIALSSGTLTLSGTSTYQGPTTVSGGSLLVGSAHALGNGSAVSVSSGATLNFQTQIPTVGALSNNGTILAANTVNVASYTQGANGVLTLNITAPGVSPLGNIVSSGLITLDGTLNITGGSITNNNIVLLQGSSRSGRFATPPTGYALKYSSKTVDPATVSLITASCTGNWISGSSSGNWGVSGNWGGGCIPGISSPSFDVATLPTVAQGAVAIVLSDGSTGITPSLFGLTFDSADTSYTIQPFAGAAASAIQLQSTGIPSIDVVSGSHTINANIQGISLITFTDAILNIASGAQLTLGSNCTISDVTILLVTDEGGPGTLINNGYMLPSLLTLEGNTITNAGWMIPLEDMYIQGTANITNTGLLSSLGFFTISGGTVNNEALILSATMTISGGTLISSGDISMNTIYLEAGTVTNTGLITTEALDFSGGTLVNSSLITTTSFVETGSPEMTVQVLNPTSFGGITASTATLAGSLVVDALPGFSMGGESNLTLIATGSNLTSQFSSVTFQNFPGSVIPSIVYSSENVELSLVPVTPSATGSLATAAQFASVGQHNMILMRKNLQLRNRFQVESSDHNGYTTDNLFAEADAVFAEGDPILAEITSPIERRSELLSVRATEQPTALPWSVYLGPVASFGNIYSKGGQPGAGYYSVGALGGFDLVLEDKEVRPCYVGLGSAIEYRYRSGTVKWNSGSFNIQKLHATVYSTVVPKAVPALAFDFLAGYAYEWDNLYRRTGIAQQLTAVGRPNQQVVDFLFDMEYTFSKKHYASMPANWAFIPLLDLQYIYDRVSSYQERNAGLYNLRIGKQTAQSLSSVLGARIDYFIHRPNLEVRLELDGGWQREYLDQDRLISYVAFNTDSPSASTIAYGGPRNSWLLGMDFLATTRKNIQIEASCDVKWNSLFYDVFFYLGVGKQF